MFNLFSDLLMIRRFVSLAKWWTWQCFIATRRSLMYGRKSKGGKVDPCGTPLEVLDAKPLIDRNSLRFAKYNSNHLFANPRIPWWHNLLNRMLWSKVSKAFWRSTKIPHAKLPSSRAFIITSVRFNRAYEAEKFCRKPNWREYMLFLWRNL